MPEFSEAKIREALFAAKDISAAKDARREYAIRRQANLSRPSQIVTNQRAVENLLTSFLAKADFDVERFEKIRANNEIALAHILQEQEADAIKRSSSTRDYLRDQVSSRLKAIEALPSPPKYELLDRPFLVMPTSGLSADTPHVEPANSSAKIKLLVDSDDSVGYEELSFYFIFQNPNDRFAVVDVDAYLVANGNCTVRSAGGMLFGFRTAGVVVEADLHLWEWWNQPPTEPFPQVHQSQNIAFFRCFSEGFFSGGAIDGGHIFRGKDLRYNAFVIPPHSFVVFEVVLSLLYWCEHGQVEVNFASGDLEVICPAVLVAILT